MKHLALLLGLAFSLSLVACAADDSEEPATEPASATETPAPATTDPPAPTATSSSNPTNVAPEENTKHATSLCAACGPLPDPWRDLSGPLPDPWTGGADQHK